LQEGGKRAHKFEMRRVWDEEKKNKGESGGKKKVPLYLKKKLYDALDV